MIKTLAVILTITVTANLSVADYDLNKGIVFLHQGNYLMTTSRWTLVIDIPMEALDTQVERLEGYIRYLNRFMDTTETVGLKKEGPHLPLWYITRKETIHLEQMLSDFEKTVNDIKSLVTVQRNKRGLIDAGGKLLKFLFGVSTNDEFLELSGKIDTLTVKQDKIIHIIEAQASVLNQTIITLRNQCEEIKDIAKRFGLQSRMLAFKYAFYTGTVLRYVESTFAEFRSHLNLIREAIDVLGQGHLSSYFAPHETLLQALLEIQTSLPAEFSLIEVPTTENLFKFYKWITVTSVALPKKLRIFAEIPLVTPEEFFDLYEIFKFPAYFPKVSAYVYYQTKFSYIALSNNRQSYMLLNSYDISKCKTDTIAMCSPEVPILKPPTQACEYVLFLGQDAFINKLCEKCISHNYSPIFRRISMQGEWIYSTSTEISLVIECPKEPEILKTQSKLIKIINTGSFTLPMVCSGYAPGMKLTSYFQSKSFISVSLGTNVVVPPITEILNETEQEIIKSFSNLSMTGQREKEPLNHALPLELASTSLKEIQKELITLNNLKLKETKKIDDTSFPLKLHLPSIIGSTTSILVIIIIALIICFLIKRKHKSIKQSSPVVVLQSDPSGNLERKPEEIPLREIKEIDATASSEATEIYTSAPITFATPRL